MKKFIFIGNLLLIFSFGAKSENKLNILTSTMNLKSITKIIGKNKINLESITKGPQDPHYLSAKPSYMLKAKKADLLIFTGMDLEVGWLPGIIRGSRNLRIQKGQEGYLDTSYFIEALSIPKGKVDRFFGDIHPFGNPHFLLDPLKGIEVSKGISERLALLDPKNRDYYLKNQRQFEKNLKEKMKSWRKRIQRSGVTKIVTYHNNFEYFLKQFQLNLLGLVEEKAGIPPSAKHVLKLIQKMKKNQSSCILISSFYNDKRIYKINDSLPVHIETVAIEVKALEKVTSYTLVIEEIVKAIENCGQFNKKGRV